MDYIWIKTYNQITSIPNEPFPMQLHSLITHRLWAVYLQRSIIIAIMEIHVEKRMKCINCGGMTLNIKCLGKRTWYLQCVKKGADGAMMR